MKPYFFQINFSNTLYIPVMPPKLCNGTRLVVQSITKNNLKVTILTGKFKGEIVLLSRIPLILSKSPIQFKRLQFFYWFSFRDDYK
jgi:hypothetical protein